MLESQRNGSGMGPQEDRMSQDISPKPCIDCAKAERCKNIGSQDLPDDCWRPEDVVYIWDSERVK